MAVYGNNISTQVEDFLEGVEMSDCISDYTPLNEMSYVVIEQTEEEFNKIMMECGVRELAYVAENHTEMVYEASGIKKLVDDVKKWFENVWAKIKKMINTALDKIAEASVKFRTKILKNLNKDFLRKRLANIADDKNFGTTYDFVLSKSENALSEKNKTIITALEKAESDIATEGERVNKEVKAGSSNLGDVDTKCKAIIKNAISGLGTKDLGRINNAEFSESNVKALLTKMFRGNQVVINGKEVKNNFDTWLDEVEKFPKTKRDLKTAYTLAKTNINQSIKTIKGYDTSKFFEPSVFTKVVKYMKTLKQLVITCQQSVISCASEREAFYRSVIIKVIGTKPVKESSVWDDDYFSESSTSDTISAMFEW